MSPPDFILKSFEYLIDYERRLSADDYKQALNQMFEFLQLIEAQLQMDSWTLLLDTVFDRLYRNLAEQLAKPEGATEDFKEIFTHVLKKVYVLLAGNRTRPVEVVRRNYEMLYELSRSQNKVILDLLMLSLNDVIGENLKLTDNPWIDQLWEEPIEFLARLFNDFFPNEVG